MLSFDPYTEFDDLARGLLTADRRTGSARSPRFMPMDFYQTDDNGALTVTIAVAERAKPRRILVEYGEDEPLCEQRVVDAPPELTQKDSSTLQREASMNDQHPIPSADPADVAEQADVIDLAAAIEDYPWVRRDEVVTVAGRTFFF